MPIAPETMTVSIRAAIKSDLPSIARIYAHAVLHGTASFELEPPDENEMTRRYHALVDNNYPYLVAEDNAALIGYAYAGPHRTRPAYNWTVEDSIYIAPEWQRRGIGGMLLSRLIAESERRNYRQMIAVIGDSNQIGSIKVHERHGFSLIGTYANVGFKFNRWLDSVLMQRTLGRGAETPP